MMARLALLVAVSVAAAQPQQSKPTRDDLEWALALRGRFAQLHDPVTIAYAQGELASIVCAINPEDGAALFQGSMDRLRMLTPANFKEPRHPLPVPSFTAQWKFLTTAAAKCSPDLQALADDERARQKMQQERQQANDDLRRAYALLDDFPDRAGQLAEKAISASDPTLLDIEILTQFLSELRERAADVASDIFPEALDFISSAQAPSPGLLLTLGKYLFTSPEYRDYPDYEQHSDVHQVGNTTIANFAANRKSASSDDIQAYIEAVLKVVTATNDPYYDPVAAYAIASQMVSKADDVAPDLAPKLREVLAQVTALAGSSVAQVQATLGGTSMADPDAGEGPRARYRLVGRILAAAGSGKFAEAREMVKSVGEIGIQAQLKNLIDFDEAGAALEKRDVQWAFTLAGPLKGGVKRALLYAGIAATTHDRNTAMGYFSLGLRDADQLPPEQRMIATAGMANAMLPLDAENGYLALSQFVSAANDAYTNPHQGRFDPAVVRKIYAGRTTTSTDTALILANRRCVCEVVDTGLGRRSFGLKVPGVGAFRLPDVIRNVRGTDPDRLEAILLGLRDETLMARGLNALAAMRLAR